MGLCIRPGDAAWSYSGFNDFRRRLAALEGIELDKMEGFGGLRAMPAGTRPWDRVESTLVPLLSHSDCDGYLNSGECEDMLPRLREIAEKWEREQFASMDLRYDLAQLRNLIDGMEHSALFGCSLVFA